MDTSLMGNAAREEGARKPAGLLPAALLLWLVIALAGCMKVGPSFVPPPKETPLQWSPIADPALTPGQEVTRQWWTVFDDPLLTELIEGVDRGNLDLKTSVARVEEARARLGVVSSDRFPTIDSTGSVARQRYSENSPSAVGGDFTEHRVGLDSSWEIDLFGRISRSVEAAAADLEASREDRLDVMVSLYAETARSYLLVRTLQARLAATMGNIESQKQVLELTRARFRFGLATDLDVAQSEDILASSEAQVPPLRGELIQIMNNIALLTGAWPGTLQDSLSEVKPIPLPKDSTAVGIPADLVRRRPDIRRAERQLAAQTARIGVATADLYPTFSLLGTFGFDATDAAKLFNARSHAYSFGPSFRWNVFDAGRIRNQIKVQDALTEQALLQYEQAVLKALGEVENAMVAYHEERNRMNALERAVTASRRTLSLAIQLYKEGLKDFQSVLDAQRTLFDQENQLAQARGVIAINLVQLYKALGGGWEEAEG